MASPVKKPFSDVCFQPERCTVWFELSSRFFLNCIMSNMEFQSCDFMLISGFPCLHVFSELRIVLKYQLLVILRGSSFMFAAIISRQKTF